jgi:cytochrome c biogenesis protein
MFSSLRLTVILLICLAAFSILGTLVLQKEQSDPHKFHLLYPPTSARYRIMQFFGLFDVYHSWWFRLALLLLVVNLVVCSIKKLRSMPRYFKRPDFRFDRGFLKNAPNYCEIEIPPGIPPEDVIDRVRKALPSGTRLFSSTEGEIRLLAENSKAAVFCARYGFFFVHFSLLVLFAGVILGSALGFHGFVELGEGEEKAGFQDRGTGEHGMERPFGFTLRADKIWEVFYENGEVKDYFTKLSVIENGKEVLQKVIQVNDPLIYKGIRFYQSSFREAGATKLAVRVVPKDGSTPEAYQVEPGGSFTCLGGQYHVQVLNFFPDFAMEPGSGPFSRSDELLNPAVQLLIQPRTGEPVKTWSFLKFPEFHGRKEGLDADFVLASVEPGYQTGLEIDYDPGVNFIWAGSGLMVLGMCFVFYTAHKRYYGILSRKDGKDRLLLAGITSRFPTAFAREFQKTAGTLSAPRSALSNTDSR